MNYILDTNVLIFMLMRSEKLSLVAEKEIFSTQNKCYVSSISLWEISIKKQIGKLSIVHTNEELVEFLEKIGLIILDITPDLINTYQHLPLTHRDPFDRMIISHALQKNYSIISSDNTFPSYGVRTLW